MEASGRRILSGKGLIACLAMVAAGCTIIDQPRGKPQATPRHIVHYFVEWSGNNIGGDGLEVVALAEDAMATRLLIRRSGKPRLILSQCVDAGQGMVRTRLVDDESGWWIEVRDKNSATAGPLPQFFVRRALAERKGYHVVVETSVGDTTEVDVAWHAAESEADPWWPLPEMAKAAVEKAREHGHLASLPDGISQSAGFLDAITENPSSSESGHDQRSAAPYRPVVAVVLEMSGALGSRRRGVMAAITERGRGLDVPQIHGFLASFQAVSADDPMGEFALKKGRCEPPRGGS